LGNVSSFKNGGPNQVFTWAFGRTTSGLGAGGQARSRRSW
jgi:hypothetical protein